MDDAKQTSSNDDTSGRVADLSQIAPEMFELAKKRRTEIEKLLALPRIRKKNMEAACAALELGQTQVYALIKSYKAQGTLTSLMPKKPSGGKGRSRLPDEVEAIMQTVIDELYINKKQRLKPFKIIKEIRLRCYKRGLPPPGSNTIRRRLKAIPAKELTAGREGRKVARDKFQPVTGSFPEPKYPVDVLQFDHTKVDIQVVDEYTGLAIGRPWLTIAYDVKTKAIQGIYLSLDPPSSTSVGLCLVHATLPKDEYLAGLELDTKWEMYGKPGTIHVDNGSDFRSQAMRTGCEQHGISLEYRPLGSPRFGGGVERAFRTLMAEVQHLPGTTFSNVTQKRGYNSEKHAGITLRGLEKIIVTFITKEYHERVHSALHMSPRKAWELGIFGTKDALGRGLPEVVKNPRRFLIDFLELDERVIDREGIVWDYIHYYDDLLLAYIYQGKTGKHLVRRDPRNASKLFLWSDPVGDYLEIPYRDRKRPPVSVWEIKAAKKRLKEYGLKHVNEALIFEGIEEIRDISESEVASSKIKRKQHSRRVQGKRAHDRMPAESNPDKTDKDFKDQKATTKIDVNFTEKFDDIEHW